MVSFLTYTVYPGDPAVYPLYRTIVKENLTALHRNCDLKVLCGDKIRFALYYEESGEEKLYLLNTDFNVLHEVKVLYRTREINTEIAPTELKIISFVAEGAGSA